ncbi:toll/interleukin-1 receptor domain-containing protein [Bradyrhizobium canariense]|uniref:Uncharacterized protein n=1 Tax=Bradyrhizobium canariense TaxID=255045 RepID=A0A1X3H3C1_9BRAD|nr:TIR domain-containing protein [Bradyrhizobium canariense]OSI68612.1 hypothetical protein BSZ22_20835 [Bradyrhizobium canariense]OSI78060.1 hypothetical protein BSZ23_19835 [Bradyrhizobium canariense]OSI89290.1 hypothetical protein BSZ25_21305 [Bradyrhizobium canariense]OSI93119.1 hypothetical protein BSZ24_13425 [Bradyrhizobium canariense]OSJ03089.1 hypothetical protein BSZ16_16730 [Bradyrhizobium canariense]
MLSPEWSKLLLRRLLANADLGAGPLYRQVQEARIRFGNWVDAFWGYDVFIAHRRVDASEYARHLYEGLRAERISCFIDRAVYTPGTSLQVATNRHVRKSTLFCLIGSPELLIVRTPVDWVVKEIETYLSSHTVDPKVLLIDFGDIVAGELAKSVGIRSAEAIVVQLGPFLRQAEDLSALSKPPSDDVLACIRANLAGRRRDRSRLRFFQAIAGVLACLLLGVALLGVFAWTQKQLAEGRARVALSRLLASDAQTYLLSQPDLSALLSVEAYHVDQTVEARSALLAAVSERPRLYKTLPRVPKNPLSAAIDSGGTQLAVGGADGLIRLWRLPNGEPVGEPFGIGHDDSVWKLAFKPDGHTLISANDSALYVWDVRDANRVGVPISGSKKNMLGIAFNPEGTMLVGGGDDDNLYVWDTSTNEARLEKTIQAGSKGIWDVAFSPRGDIFASGGRDGAITLWRSKDLSSPPDRLVANHGQVSSLAIGSDGVTLLSGYEDGTIIVWNMDTRAPVGEPIKHGSGLDHVALSQDLKLIAAGGTGEPLGLWDITSHEKVQSLPLTDFDSINALLYTPDHRFLISIQEDYCLLWNMSESDELNHELVGHTQKIWALASNRSGTVLASGGKDGSVLLWDMATRRRLDPPLKLSHSYVKALAFDPTKELLAVGHDNGTITIWSMSTHQQIAPPLRFHKEPIIALTYSHDGHYLAAGSADGTVAIYDPSGPTEVASYQHEDAISGLDFNSDGNLLASSGDDGKIILWDVRLNGPDRAPIETKPDEAEHVRFSPDGHRLAWFDGTRIVLWDLRSPLDQRIYLQGIVDKVNSLAFSPDGSLIASSTMDHQIALWDTKSHQRLPRALQGHTDIVWNAIFIGNRDVVASSSNDLTIRLWDVHIDTWLSRLCEIANRNLSRDEWVQYLGSEPYRKTCPGAP